VGSLRGGGNSVAKQSIFMQRSKLVRKRTILNLILVTVIVAGLLTPATAQTPPPPVLTENAHPF